MEDYINAMYMAFYVGQLPNGAVFYGEYTFDVQYDVSERTVLTRELIADLKDDIKRVARQQFNLDDTVIVRITGITEVQ